MKTTRAFRFASLIFALTATLVTAGPLHRADVAANPCWIFHLDCDALRKTYLGQYLLYNLDKPELHSNMVAFESLFGFDPRTQLHGITIYSAEASPDRNVTILYADFKQEQLIKLVGMCPDAAIITNVRRLIYSWVDPKAKSASGGPIHKYAVFEDHKIITAESRPALMAALPVVDGTAPNLVGSGALLDLSPLPETSFLQAAARRMEFLDGVPNAGPLKTARRLKLEAHEVAEQLRGTLRIEAPDDTTAAKLSMMAQGFVALLSLQKDNPTAAKLANDFSVAHEGQTVTVGLNMPANDLVAGLKAFGPPDDSPQTAVK